MKTIAKKILSSVGLLDILRSFRSERSKRIIYNVNKDTNKSRRCLFLYITKPFVTKNYSEIHQNLWQATEIARIIGSRGFIVDVADYTYKKEPKFNYDLVVGLIPRGIDIYSTHLNPNAKIVAYLTSMDLKVTTDNESQRLAELKERRGVTLLPRRGSKTIIEKKIESFNAVWHIGNEYNYHSYDYFKMPPVFYIKNSGYAFDWVKHDVIRDSKSFVFFASSGQVHKGLDLLLDVFANKTPDCTLYVCSCYEEEEDFKAEYREELFNRPNIKPMGFVDIEGNVFKEITSKCSYLILPSCAEARCGSVLTAMSAGLIPIVSKECGYDDDEVINLLDCRIDTIASYVDEYSKKDQAWIEEKSRNSINLVKKKYSKQRFTESIERAVDGVLAL